MYNETTLKFVVMRTFIARMNNVPLYSRPLIFQEQKKKNMVTKHTYTAMYKRSGNPFIHMIYYNWHSLPWNDSNIFRSTIFFPIILPRCQQFLFFLRRPRIICRKKGTQFSCSKKKNIFTKISIFHQIFFFQAWFLHFF